MRDPGHLNVLIVEDDPNNRIVISRLLALNGVKRGNVHEVDGDPLARLPRDSPPCDLVFLDLQMPLKDGFSVLRDLRSDPRFSQARVVALTANVMKSDVDRARAAGFDGFIGKPIDGRGFSGVFARLLAGESVWSVR